jgi:mono/diheme cytochrome c family protein
MSLRLLVTSAALVVLLTTACSDTSTPTNTNTNSTAVASPTATPDEFAVARMTFEKNCVRCHQKTGEGGPVKLEDGTRLKVPSFREGHALRHTDADFVKQITKGGDGMPAFGPKLKPEEINELVRFIRHEFQAGATPAAEPMKSPMKDMKMK